MPGFKVSNGSTYVDTKGVSVSNGSTYVAAKGVYVSQGNGTWTPVWPLLSTVSLSNPSWALSNASGQNPWSAVANTIVSPTFTVTLSNPSAVASVSLQLSYAGGAWTEYKNWASGITGTLTHAIPFTTNGAWQARAIITHTSGSQVISNVTSITCYKKSLIIYANGSTAAQAPAEGSTVTFTFACADDCAPVQTSQSLLYTTNGSPWTVYSDPVVDSTWEGAAGNEHWWVYRETFADGSVIHSQYVSVDPAPLTEVVASDNSWGGQAGAAGLQAAMTYARGQGLPLRITGGWGISGDVWIPDGLTVTAYGAGFTMGPGRFRNSGRWPAASMTSEGGYDGGGFSWSGGEFNGNNDGIFTLSHCPWATIQGTTMYHWAIQGNTGHAIEINSSGGADNASGEYGMYNINILGNNFGGLVSQRTNGNDEAISYDYAWPGSGNAGADDMTMCHNVKVDGNTFHQQWGGGEFVKCAIGGHDNGTYTPPSRHNHFTFRNNNIHGSWGSDGTNPDKGVIHLYWVRSSWVVFNNFYGCNPARLMQIELPSENSTASPYFNFTGGSTSNNGGSPNAWTSVNTPDTNT